MGEEGRDEDFEGDSQVGLPTVLVPPVPNLKDGQNEVCTTKSPTDILFTLGGEETS